MSTEDRIAYIAVTKKGTVLAGKLKRLMGIGDIYTTAKVKVLLEELESEVSPEGKAEELLIKMDDHHTEVSTEDKNSRQIEVSPQDENSRQAELSPQEVNVIEGTLGTFTKELFASYDFLVFIMATGIVVRVIAPYVASKFQDPAVIVLDECGENVISLLSGHMGGANEMTRKISSLLEAHPVITTATDVNHKAALDCLVKELDAYVENMREVVKRVNYSLVQGETVGLYIEGSYQVDERGFTRLDILNEQELKEQLSQMEEVIYISHEYSCRLDGLVESEKLIKVIPRRFVIGIGCKKDTSVEHMQNSFMSFMSKHQIHPRSIKQIGSIELKKDEAAIKALASKLEIPFKVFTKEELAEVEHLFEGSAFVKKTIGVSCVAEPSAYLLGAQKVLVSKEKYNGITFALGEA